MDMFKYMNCFHTFVVVLKQLYPYVQVSYAKFLTAFKVTPEVFSLEQSSSSTLTKSILFFIALGKKTILYLLITKYIYFILSIVKMY